MSETVVQIVTAYANKDAALALSTPPGGVPATSFVAYATTDSSGHSPQPTHCWDNGSMDDTLIALFVADPTNYAVTYFSNHNPWPALSTHVPQLYAWLGA